MKAAALIILAFAALWWISGITERDLRETMNDPWENE